MTVGVIASPDPAVQWRFSGRSIERTLDGGRTWTTQATATAELARRRGPGARHLLDRRPVRSRHALARRPDVADARRSPPPASTSSPSPPPTPCPPP